ncbi:MAG TPA: signal peptidase I [Steroidobacteraceae bacterium]|jgi:signal peptidase I|nr:signal peptidase I [Steroidobacteraceae bacterium]
MKNKRAWFRKEVAPMLLALVLVTAARSSFADHYYVPSGSMENTLFAGDRVVVDKTAYGWRIPYTKIDVIEGARPQPGEVAVFDSPADGILLIKRIVAIGGQVVSLHEGHLTVDGKPLAPNGAGADEVFASHVATLNLADGGGPEIKQLVIPPGKLLAIGDHRGNSFDARYWGLIDERELYGRAVAVYYRRSEGFVWKAL